MPERIESGNFAPMVKLVDTLDLGSSAARLGGSSPLRGTMSAKRQNHYIAHHCTLCNRISGLFAFDNSIVLRCWS